MTQNSAVCPSCSSKRIWKDGIRYKNGKDMQRYLCKTAATDSHNITCKIRALECCSLAENV